eukprot:scaffold289_cov147-Amphora_coffeaeformis.AAC.9
MIASLPCEKFSLALIEGFSVNLCFVRPRSSGKRRRRISQDTSSDENKPQISILFSENGTRRGDASSHQVSALILKTLYYKSVHFKIVKFKIQVNRTTTTTSLHEVRSAEVTE